MKKIRSIIFLALISTLLSSCADLASRIPTYTEEDEKMYRALVDINEQEFIEAVNEGADPNKFETSHGGTYSPLVYAVNSKEGAIIDRLVQTILSYDIDPNMTDPSFLGLSDKIVFEKILYDSTVFYALLPKVDLDTYGEEIIDTMVDERCSVDYYISLFEYGAVVTENNINNLVDKVRDRLKRYSINSYCNILPEIDSLYVLINNYDGSSDSNLLKAFNGTFSENDECDEDLVLYGIAAACGSDIFAKHITEDTDIDYLLRIAVMCGNIDNIDYLVEQGANLRFIEEKTYMNILRYAVLYSTVETAEYVLSLNSEDVNDCFYYAVYNRNFEMVKLLIDYGADVNYEKAFYAAINSTPEIIKYFIDNGCDLNRRSEGLNERHILDMFGISDTDSVKYALRFCDGLSENEMLIAIDNCVTYGDLETLKYLKELGANDFNTPFMFEGSTYRYEQTPLETAVKFGYFDIVKFLVENGTTAELLSEEEFYGTFIYDVQRSNDICSYLMDNRIIDEEDLEEAQRRRERSEADSAA
ncbi:MAG: ankyrin repeat domain-containing protein [Clostridiales bacterium]|nr:ankyrin repeat domain-containing protein [Clostridiales bacterium]